jgi:hypothetical protein
MNKLSTEEKVKVVACLVEGNSLRATTRMTGTHRWLSLARPAPRIRTRRFAISSASGFNATKFGASVTQKTKMCQRK